ncbi:hypothetical protein B0F90DRAFT_1821626 [Multifurca ochricompacta]|uniref:Uncharacterized protein n=1 Tax=Multifurca ochricompacta TaxID=376703 RepID=A0AAD4LXG2_9AGAM|nr:hypothetical protein B0F90DRAFT_1821626 [Multifurca ochricompacta]
MPELPQNLIGAVIILGSRFQLDLGLGQPAQMSTSPPALLPALNTLYTAGANIQSGGCRRYYILAALLALIDKLEEKSPPQYPRSVAGQAVNSYETGLHKTNLAPYDPFRLRLRENASDDEDLDLWWPTTEDNDSTVTVTPGITINMLYDAMHLMPINFA